MRYVVGCDLAYKKSCVFIQEVISKNSTIILYTNRKKLLEQSEYISLDKKFHVYFYDSDLYIDNKIELIMKHLIPIKNDIMKLNIEGYSYGSTSNRHIQNGELIGCVKYVLRLNKIFYNIIQPTTLKKWATGSGKADKKMMYESLKGDMKNYITELANINNIKVDKDGINDITDSFFLGQYKK